MKGLTAFFGVGVAGIVVSFAMSIYTAIHQHAEAAAQPTSNIVVPAVAH